MAEEVGEVLGVEFAKALTIVDGLAYDEQGGEGEVVVVDDLGEIFEHTTIDLLVWPCEMVAGGNGGILWVFLKEFALHIVDDGGREEDAHRARAASQKMKLLFFWHGGTTFATSKDDGLATLRNCELALQFGSGSEE